MSNRTYEIVEKIAVLSTTTRTRREVRRVRWDGSPDVFLDIRKWRQESMDQKPQARASA